MRTSMPSHDVTAAVFRAQADVIRGMLATCLDDFEDPQIQHTEAVKDLYLGAYQHVRAQAAFLFAKENVEVPRDHRGWIAARVLSIELSDEGFTAMCFAEWEGQQIRFPGKCWPWPTVWELISERIDEDTLAAWIADAEQTERENADLDDAEE